MQRLLIALAVVVMGAQFVFAAGPTVGVSGQLAGGNNVSASCTVIGTAGQATGAGVLYGTNPQNGYKYSYPFSISSVSSAPGVVVLTGKLSSGPSVVLRASVPQGGLTFSYVVNGQTYTLAGTGTVTVR